MASLSGNSRRGVEIRVHGIGDHDAYAALGPPEVIVPRETAADTIGLPVIPAHELRSLNWSRTSRHLTRFFWYLAFPFTLVNLAGHMIPGRDQKAASFGRAVMAVTVLISGVIVSVTGLVWTMATAETILRPMEGGADAFLNSARLIGSLWFTGVIIQTMWGLKGDVKRRWASLIGGVFNAGVVLAVTGAIIHFQPTQLPAPALSSVVSPLGVNSPVDNRALQTIREVYWQPGESISAAACLAMADNSLFENRLDPLNLVLIGSISAIVALALIMAAVAVVLPTRGRPAVWRPVLAGAGLVLSLAIVIMNAIGSSVRLGVDWLMRYLVRYDVVGTLGGGSELGWAGSHDRYLLPYQNQGCQLGSVIIDTFAPVAVAGLLILAAILAISNARNGFRLHRTISKRAAMEYIHKTIVNAGRTLPYAVPAALLLWIWLVAEFWNHLAPSQGSIRGIVAVIAQAFGALAVLLVLFLGRLRPIRMAFGHVTDVAGFWPARWHPLSAPSYRPHVLKALEEELQTEAQPLVLVGHSQGSVIAVWYLGTSYEGPRIELVTCGSPLVSLYATFFPGYFTPKLFKDVRHAAHWANFWRETDPIATFIPAAHDNTLLADTVRFRRDLPQRPWGHSHYWIEPDQIVHIARRIQLAQQTTARIATVTIKTNQPTDVARFWRELLGYRIEPNHSNSVKLVGDEGGPALVIEPADQPIGQGAIQLDLRTEDQSACVQLALSLGGTHVDIGQARDDGRVVMADAGGNLFCVLQTRAH